LLSYLKDSGLTASDGEPLTQHQPVAMSTQEDAGDKEEAAKEEENADYNPDADSDVNSSSAVDSSNDEEEEENGEAKEGKEDTENGKKPTKKYKKYSISPWVGPTKRILHSIALPGDVTKKPKRKKKKTEEGEEEEPSTRKNGKVRTAHPKLEPDAISLIGVLMEQFIETIVKDAVACAIAQKQTTLNMGHFVNAIELRLPPLYTKELLKKVKEVVLTIQNSYNEKEDADAEVAKPKKSPVVTTKKYKVVAVRKNGVKGKAQTTAKAQPNKGKKTAPYVSPEEKAMEKTKAKIAAEKQTKVTKEGPKKQTPAVSKGEPKKRGRPKKLAVT